MVAVWCDTPSEEYIEKKSLISWSFANHNKDYFKADFTALRKAVATVPTDLDIYTPESRAALAKVLDSLNWNVRPYSSRSGGSKNGCSDPSPCGLKRITQVGSLAENDVKALVEDKPSLEIVEKNLILTLWNGPIQIS